MTLAHRCRLGKNWRRLHRLVYPTGIIALGHVWWGLKVGVAAPITTTVILALLLFYRVAIWGGWRLVSASDSGMEIPERPSKRPLQDVNAADATVSPQ